jgi:hypothetical protein
VEQPLPPLQNGFAALLPSRESMGMTLRIVLSLVILVPIFVAALEARPNSYGNRFRTAVRESLTGPTEVRLFLMKATMFGLPAEGLHMFRNAGASMQITIASLIAVVDAGEGSPGLCRPQGADPWRNGVAHAGGGIRLREVQSRGDRVQLPGAEVNAGWRHGALGRLALFVPRYQLRK